MQMKRKTKEALCISCQTGLAITAQEAILELQIKENMDSLYSTSQITRKRIENKAKEF